MEYVSAIAKRNLPQAVIEQCEKLQIYAFSGSDPYIPTAMRSLPKKPRVLFCRGNPRVLILPKKISITGTRRPSKTGRQLASDITKMMVKKKYVIVSGLSRGIDFIAHKTTIANYFTIGVMPFGLDLIHERTYEALAKVIMQRGCLVSEHPPGIGVKATRNPQGFTYRVPTQVELGRRHRILLGLTRYSIFIEGNPSRELDDYADISLAIAKKKNYFMMSTQPDYNNKDTIRLAKKAIKGKPSCKIYPRT